MLTGIRDFRMRRLAWTFTINMRFSHDVADMNLYTFVTVFIQIYYIFSSDLLRFVSELQSIIYRVNNFISNVLTL